MIRLLLDSSPRLTPFLLLLAYRLSVIPCEIIFLRYFNEDDAVLLPQNIRILLADIKLKGPSPTFLSLSFSRRRATYRRDRFLAYNILSLVADREETKRAYDLAFGFIAAALSVGRFYLSLFALLSSFLSSFFSVFRRVIARPDAFYGALTPRCRRRCYVRSTPRKSGSTDARLYAP